MPMPYDEELVDSWEIWLRAERKSASTIKNYTAAVRAYTRWCTEHDRPHPLERHAFAAYMAALVEEGLYGDSTMAIRHMGVRRFAAWVAAEERVENELLLVTGPKIDDKVVQPLTDEEIASLIRACQGTRFRDRRDEAIVRVFAESGPRASDLLSMTISGTSIKDGTAVLRGKGGGERMIAFGPKTAHSLDRYLRMRKAHASAGTDAFWLGDRNRGFSYGGLYKAMAERAEDAGIAGFHMHRLRHAWTDRWLDRGGSEGGLMALAGWKNRKMIDRYGKARAARRALDEARRLDLGDL